MELSHTLEVKPNLWIRGFIKFYGLSKPYNLNTCKLAWGSLGMVVIPPLLLIFSPLIALIAAMVWLGGKIQDALVVRTRNKRSAYYALPPEEREALAAEEAKPSRREAFLNKLSMKASAVWYKVQTPVTWFFRVFVILAVLVGLIVLVVWAVGVVPGLPWGDILEFSWKLVLWILGGAVIGALVVGFFAWLEVRKEKRIKKGKRPSVIKAMFNSIHDHTCANIKVVDESSSK